jgi:hypothetical protein
VKAKGQAVKRRLGKALILVSVWITSGASIWIGGSGQIGLAASTESAESGKKIVVHITDYASVDRKVLDRALEITSRVFQHAGVESVLLMDSPETEQMNPSHSEVPELCHLFVAILTREMADRLGLPANFMGVTPGPASELNRRRVFVFDQMVEKLAREQVTAALEKKIFFVAGKAQILGYAIAHEIGHALLHQAAHSQRGIMQSSWDRDSMQRIAVGTLTFSPEEVERIQAEVVRRGGSKQAVQARDGTYASTSSICVLAGRGSGAHHPPSFARQFLYRAGSGQPPKEAHDENRRNDRSPPCLQAERCERSWP